MALMGAEGLARAAARCHTNTRHLGESLCALPGVAPRFDRPVFHEQVVTLPVEVKGLLRALAAHNILGGFDLSRDYPELGHAILICATEKRSADEIESFVRKLERAISLQRQAGELGVGTMDFAKRLLDYGVQLPASCFDWPLSECLLIEPTETWHKATLDNFVAAMQAIQKEARTDPDLVRSAPHTLSVGRLNDVHNARELSLAWKRTQSDG